ncbi:MAG: tetratricopeptide repeat protein [Thermodesulfobacteriota bacterium]
MSKDEASKHFAEGKRLMQKDRLDRAMRAFGKAHREDRTNPSYMSYYGLTKALKGGDIGFGIDLCTRAIKKEFSRAEFYLNLGKVYLSVGNTKGAVNIFKKGIKFEPGNKELKKQLSELGITKPSGMPMIEGGEKAKGFFSKLFAKVFQA